MKILVVGMGAVGGYFGGRLLDAGRDVTFFVRPKRALELAKRGLNIQSPFGDLRFSSPPAITTEQLAGASFDLAILSCKAQDLTGIIDSFAPAVGPKTLILPLLNGMRHIDLLIERFGRDRVLGGTVRVSVARNAEGDIIQNTQFQEILFGTLDKSQLARVPEVYATLANAGFDVQAKDTILQDVWDKWVFMGTLAAVTCLMRASIGDIEAAGAGGLTLKLLDEAAAIARLEGFVPQTEPFNVYRSMLTKAGSPVRASTLRDIETHSATEGTHIVGDLLARAQRHGFSAPMLEIADFHLKCYDVRRLREAAEEAL
jgi:2-dehydropantoate 2-reductase